MSSITIESSIHGHHVYRTVWTPMIDEVLACKREQHNIHDPFAVAVRKGSTVVGHVPQHISAMCYMFLGKSECSISCKVTGHRRYSHDLPQGGMEVPCHLIFAGKDADVQKIRNLIVSLSNAQLITTIIIVEGDAKEVAEDLGMAKYVITEDKSGGNAVVTEDPAAATLANVENPETYSSDISGDNTSDDANLIKCTYAADQNPNPIDINSTEGVSSSHTTISPLDLVTEILKSSESLTESAILDVESESSCFHGTALNLMDLSVSS